MFTYSDVEAECIGTSQWAEKLQGARSEAAEWIDQGTWEGHHATKCCLESIHSEYSFEIKFFVSLQFTHRKTILRRSWFWWIERTSRRTKCCRGCRRKQTRFGATKRLCASKKKSSRSWRRLPTKLQSVSRSSNQRRSSSFYKVFEISDRGESHDVLLDENRRLRHELENLRSQTRKLEFKESMETSDEQRLEMYQRLEKSDRRVLALESQVSWRQIHQTHK